MPIHDVGYRRWKGEITATWSRWTAITSIGIRTALSSRWIRRILLAAWFPVIYFGIILFIFEGLMVTTPSGPVSGNLEMLKESLQKEGAFLEMASTATTPGDSRAIEKTNCVRHETDDSTQEFNHLSLLCRPPTGVARSLEERCFMLRHGQ